MSMLPTPLRRLVSILAIVIATAIAVAVPAGFFAVQFHDETVALQFKARLGAGRVAQYVYTHTTMWQYHGPRIGELITLPDANPAWQLVFDARGRLVTEEGSPVGFPSIQVTEPIIVAGAEIGRIQAVASLRPLLAGLLVAILLSWGLAAIAFLTVRSLPIRALDRALVALGRQTILFEVALTNMTQGLCMIDQDGRVAVVNPRLVDMLRIDPATSLVGLDVEAVTTVVSAAGPLMQPLCKELLSPVSAPGVAEHRIATVSLQDGRTIGVQRQLIEGGGWLATCEDITDRLQAETDRSRALAEADLMRARAHDAHELSRAKSAFLATMSHEIRTPMNGVLGLASALLDGSLSDDQRHIVETIRDSGDSLMQILNDILEFSRLEANRLVIEAVPFSPASLAETISSVLGPRAAAKELVITVHADPLLPAALVGDPGRIRQVLMNLVSNALKFTAVGSITIETGCIAITATTATLEWRVTDTGIGVPEDKLAGLFQEFVQADSSINRRFGGSGLGLAISKRLVECMEGEISADSVAGVGSTFRFRLTLPIATAPAQVTEQKRNGAQALKDALMSLGRRPRLLVAEDNLTNQFVLRQMLRVFDLQIDTVADGAAAVAAVTASHYDLICMDVQMPGMDGISATRAIRACDGELSTIPIIALTGNAFAEDVQACYAAGMDGFLAKPVSKEALCDAILQALLKRSDAAAGTINELAEPCEQTRSNQTVEAGV